MSGKFKFKDSIRERFSHEFESHTETESSTSKTESTEIDYYAKRRRLLNKSCEHHPEDPKHHHHHLHQTTDAGKQQSETEDKKKTVPIFALHPKGSHYIPLSVNEDVIYPYLHLFDQGSDLPLMLHPISISVNFCGPIRIASGIKPQQNSQSEGGSLSTKEDHREYNTSH